MPDHSPYVGCQTLYREGSNHERGEIAQGRPTHEFPPGALQVRRTKPHDVGAGLLAGT